MLSVRIAGSGLRTTLRAGSLPVFLFSPLNLRFGNGENTVNQSRKPVVFRRRLGVHALYDTPKPSAFFSASALFTRRSAIFNSSSKARTASMFIASPKDEMASSTFRRSVLQSGSITNVTSSRFAWLSILETRSWYSIQRFALDRKRAKAAFASSASSRAIAFNCFFSASLMALQYTIVGVKAMKSVFGFDEGSIFLPA